MSMPSDFNHHFVEPLTRQQQFVFDRFTNLIAVEQDTETVLAPFMNDKIAAVVLRIRGLFDRVHKLLCWGDFDRAEAAIKQAEGCLLELKTLMRDTPNNLFCQRVLAP